MDLEPFGRIDPCGMAGLAVTQLADLGGPAEIAAVREPLCAELARRLGADGLAAGPGDLPEG
jgi:lipoyl(octanoyl) transferase